MDKLSEILEQAEDFPGTQDIPTPSTAYSRWNNLLNYNFYNAPGTFYTCFTIQYLDIESKIEMNTFFVGSFFL